MKEERCKYRSSVSTQGRLMAGARALWRANGLRDGDFDKPIVAIANSFTQFVPGHVHLHGYGQMMKQMIEAAGGVGIEFNTIAIDDGIAMGHDGMLYSLPSRELIADSVEYMVQAHRADALVCISSCDKITPGMLMAAMRLNIPAIFVAGGPMEAGVVGGDKIDLIDAMVAAATPKDRLTDEALEEIERHACPTCGSCAGMFTANSMNCLAEALGMALPGSGTLLATHKLRRELFEEAAARIVAMCEAYYERGDESVLPRSIATSDAFLNAMTVDVAMGGSTNTVLHILAVAHSAGVELTMEDIGALSPKTPCICKVRPSATWHMEDVSHAGGIPVIMGELQRAGLIQGEAMTVSGDTMARQIGKNDIRGPADQVCEQARKRSVAAPGRRICSDGFSQEEWYDSPDLDGEGGAIRSTEHPYSEEGGLCVLYGNIARDGCVVKTAGVEPAIFEFSGRKGAFSGPARVCESQDEANDLILGKVPGRRLEPGDVVVILYEGPKGGPGMQEMLYPTSYLKSMGLHTQCALITDGRFSGGTAGLSIGHVSPEAACGGLLALVREGDIIDIDLNECRITDVNLQDGEQLDARLKEMETRGTEAYQPTKRRKREVSEALRAYALLATSADRGAVRDVAAAEERERKARKQVLG